MPTYSNEWVKIKVNKKSGKVFIASDVDRINLSKDAAQWLYEQLTKSETEKEGVFVYKGYGYSMTLDMRYNMDLQIDGLFFEYDIWLYREELTWLYEQLKKIFEK